MILLSPRAKAAIFVCLGVIVTGCVTKEAPLLGGLGGVQQQFSYQFSAPEGGVQAGRDRIRNIDNILRGQNCQAPTNASHKAICSQYAMEAGLIYALVERQEIESENLLRRAHDFHQSCDLRILRAASTAKRAKSRRDLSGAATLLAGEGKPCDSTVARYYTAKLNILSDAESHLKTGREQLTDLSGYSLGNSGIAPSDLYDLSVYSFLSTSEFEQAERQLKEAFDKDIVVSPKLQALVLIGQGEESAFAIRAANISKARQYIDQRIEDYDFGQLIADLARQIDRVESVEVAPWEEVEQRIEADPNITPSQHNIVRLRFKDEFERLKDEIAQLNETKAALKAYGPDFAKAERNLVTAKIAAVFGEGDAERMQVAKNNYLASLKRIDRSLERINDIVGDMANMQNLYILLKEPEAYQRAAESALKINAKTSQITADDADVVVLRNFAKAVSRTLSPDEFFRAYEVDLDQLGFESEAVVKNVRRIMELAKQG